MKRHFCKTILGALILCLLPAAAFPALADTPDFDISTEDLPIIEYHPTVTLGDPVSIQNGEAYATPLLSVPTPNDLPYPMSLCPNGVEAREISRANGFVRVAIGGDGLNAGISGCIQEAHIVPAGTSADTPPTVTLRAGDGGDIPLLLDYTEDAEVIASYPAGTEAQLLGWLDTWCQVQIGEESGFLRTAQVEWPEAVEQGLQSVPIDSFDSLTAREKHAMDILSAYYTEKIAEYGPNEGWPVEARAEYAALSIQLGRGQIFDFGIDIMPGPEDLTQEEAMAIAAQAAEEIYGVPPEDLATYDVEVRFYDSNYVRTGRYWFFHFKHSPEANSFMITISSPEGEAGWVE